MKTIVKKWGNSAAIRIPSAVMMATNLTLGEFVDVREEEGRIIIEPVRKKTYKLQDLLKGINSKNVHELIDFGPPTGKEIW